MTNLHLYLIQSVLCFAFLHVPAAFCQRLDARELELTNAYFTDVSHGWVIGYTGSKHFILRTLDGGVHWAEVLRTPAVIRNIKFANEKVGWAIGSKGLILNTKDGGTVWTIQKSPSTDDLNGLSALDEYNVWICSVDGTVLSTANGGGTWQAQNIAPKSGLTDIAFTDAKRGWSIGYGEVFYTSNGGTTWASKPVADRKHLSSINATDSGTVLITAGPALLTINAKGDFLREIVPASEGKIFDICLAGDNVWWVGKSREVADDLPVRSTNKIVSESYILTSTDAGKNWRELYHIRSDTDHSAVLYSVVFIDSNHGWVFGRGGLALRTVDGGTSWKKMSIPAV